MTNADPPINAPTVLARGHGMLLALVLLIATALRVTGLKWGLPSRLHYFSYHPDESVVMLHSLPGPSGLDLVHGVILPHFYNYGSLQLELINFAYAVAYGYHKVGVVFGAGSIDVGSFARMLLISRCITVAMGVGTVWATFAIGRRLWGPVAGLVAAAALAVMPLHVQHSHFATVDVPATFWTTLCLHFAVNAIPHPVLGDKGGRRSLVVAGVFAGLAMATKYNCAVVILAVLAAGHIRAWSGTADGVRDARKLGAEALATVGACVAALVSFLLACPGAVLDRAKFLTDIAFERDHVYRHPEPYFQHTGPGFWFILTHNLSAAMGWLGLIVAFVGALYALSRRGKGDGVLGFFTLAYFVLVSIATSRYARYEIPILPVLALWTGRWLVEAGRTALANRVGVSVVVAAVLASMAAISAWLIAPMTGQDPRDRIAATIIGENPQPAKIAFATDPWFWSPPLNPYFSLPYPSRWVMFRDATVVGSRLIVPDKPFDVTVLERERPDLVLLSEYEYYDRLRLRDADAMAYCSYLQAHYAAHWSLVRLPSLTPPTILGMPASELPHDMLYTDPITLMYRRKD